jgi:dTDP-glucose pyrophosphorylase
MDKAVILARGLGTRMRREDPGAALNADQEQVAASGIKALIPVGRPFLDYVLAALAAAGYRRVCLVVGPEHQTLRHYYGRLECERLEIEFAVQEKPLGTADAVAAAENFAAGEPFLAINSDNYYPIEALRVLRQLDGPGLVAFERAALVTASNIPPDRLNRFAVVETDAEGCVARLIEKPDPEQLETLSRSQSTGMSMNCWRFDAGIFPACRAIQPSPRGELEITDAVHCAIHEQGQRFRVVPMAVPVLDLSSREDVEPVKALLQGVEVRL